MKKILLIFVISLTTIAVKAQTSQKYNSFYQRTEFFDSRGNLIGYAKKNTFYNLSKLEENIAVKKQLFGKSEALDDAYNEFIYSVFKQGSCDSLIALSDKTKYASGINSEDRIYKINLHDKKQNNVCNFQRIYYFQDIYDQR